MWKKKQASNGDSETGNPQAPTETIYGACLCVVSQNALLGHGRVRWAERGEPKNPADTGWVVFSDLDTDDYIADTANLVLAEYATICEREPAMILARDLPVGSDIEIIKEQTGRTRIYDHVSGRYVCESGPEHDQ